MRLAAVFALALVAAPAVAQQAPQREIDPEFAVPAPGLGENYRDQPFVFDLLLRMKPPEEGDRVLFRKQEHRTICAAEMNQSLRLEGLAKKAVQVYRDCAERLAEAERNGKVISPPPVDDHPLKDKQ